MRYSTWRKAVLTEMTRRGVDHACFLSDEGTGPLALVPSPRELCESGVPPVDFVSEEYAGYEVIGLFIVDNRGSLSVYEIHPDGQTTRTQIVAIVTCADAIQYGKDRGIPVTVSIVGKQTAKRSKSVGSVRRGV